MSTKLWTEEQFNCPVCLDLPNDPVTIPCGHSYCMDCIRDFWSKDDPKGIYSCPQCRQTFCPKPSLSRNTMLAEAVEQLRKGALKSETCDTMTSPLEVGDLPAVHVKQDASFEPIRDVILALGERIEDLCNQELGKITKQGPSRHSKLRVSAGP
uniref:RING-type domain-containing protein n=1 Tax=Nothobranchius furzeri TaxID=105023 RepID=A0A8C6NJ28_NOTFU